MAGQRYIPFTIQLDTRSSQAAVKGFSREFGQLENSGKQFGRSTSQSLLNVERDAKRAASGTSSAFTSAFQKIKSGAGGIGGALQGALSFAGGGALLGGISALTGGLANMAGAVFDVRDQLERAEVGFTTLLGNRDKAKAFIGELRQFSKITPFELSGTVSGAQNLLAQGFSQAEIIPILKGVGSATAAAGKGSQEFQSILSQLSQTASKGKAELEDLKIIAESGVPVFDILAKSIGVSQEQLFKLLSEGRLRGKETVTLLAEEFGKKFPTALEDLSKTTKGTITNITENLTGKAADALDSTFTRINKLLRETNTLLEGPGFERFAGKAQKFADQLSGSLEVGIKGLFGEGTVGRSAAAEAVGVAGDFLSGDAKLPGARGLEKLSKGESVQFKDFIDVNQEISDVKALVNKIGEAIPDGVKEGIKNKAAAVADTASELGTSLLNSLKGVLQIQSPSKRMAELGDLAGEGFEKGLIDRTSAGFQKWRKVIEKEVGDVETFLKRVEQIAAGVGANPNQLLNVLAFESRFNPQAKNPRGSATGLIQFTSATAKGLGTTVDELRTKSAIEQLDFVEKYLKQFGKVLDTQEALYTSVLAGRVVRDPDEVLFKSGTKTFKANRELDSKQAGGNEDGQITASEAAFQARKQGFTTPGKPVNLGAAVKPQNPPRLSEVIDVPSGRDLLTLPSVSLPAQIAERAINKVAQTEAPKAIEAVESVATKTNQAIASSGNQLASTTADNFKRLVRDAEQTTKEVQSSFGELREGIRDTFRGAFDQLLQGNFKGVKDSLIGGLASIGRNLLTNAIFGNGQGGGLFGGGKSGNQGGGQPSGGGGLAGAISSAITGGGSGALSSSTPSSPVSNVLATTTGGLAGGNPAQQILSGAGQRGSLVNNLLGKIPGVGRLLNPASAVGAVGKIGNLAFADTSNLANLLPLRGPGVGQLSAAGNLIQPGGLLSKIPLLGKASGFLSKIPLLGGLFGGGGGAAAGAAGGAAAGGGGFLGGLSGLLGGGGGAALFSNPVTAIIGGALIAAPFIAKLFGDRDLKNLRGLIQGEYGVEVKDNSLLTQIKEIGQQRFGKDFKSRLAETVQLPEVREIVSTYAENAGLKGNQKLDAAKLGDRFDPRNIIRREFGGPIVPGVPTLVGERRPEVAVFGQSGEIFPSIGEFEKQLVAALQTRAARGGVFNKLLGNIAGQIEGRAASGGRSGGNPPVLDAAIVGVIAEVRDALNQFRPKSANDVLMAADDRVVADGVRRGFNADYGLVNDLAYQVNR